MGHKRLISLGIKLLMPGHSNSVQHTPADHRKRVSLYDTSTVNSTNETALTAGDCILVALLSGSEYFPGVGHCNRATAHALARCGFGQTLATGCTMYTSIDRRQFIASWLDGVCNELRNNALGILGGSHPTLASHLCENIFPSNEIIDLFLFPCTSYHISTQGPNCAAWIFGEGPRIDLLAAAAINYMEFKNSAELSRTFFYHIWRAVMVKTFLSVSMC